MKNIHGKEITTELGQMINPERTVLRVVELENDFGSIAPIYGKMVISLLSCGSQFTLENEDTHLFANR